jgi:hypothetical protein
MTDSDTVRERGVDATAQRQWTWRQHTFIADADATPVRAKAEAAARTCQAANPGADVGVVTRLVTAWEEQGELNILVPTWEEQGELDPDTLLSGVARPLTKADCRRAVAILEQLALDQPWASVSHRQAASWWRQAEQTAPEQ